MPAKKSKTSRSPKLAKRKPHKLLHRAKSPRMMVFLVAIVVGMFGVLAVGLSEAASGKRVKIGTIVTDVSTDNTRPRKLGCVPVTLSYKVGDFYRTSTKKTRCRGRNKGEVDWRLPRSAHDLQADAPARIGGCTVRSDGSSRKRLTDTKKSNYFGTGFFYEYRCRRS